MAETIYEMSKRMCNGTNCEDCPLNKVTNPVCLIGLIKDYEIENVAEQLKVLYEWVKEHPFRTYKDVFLEKLPNARTGEAGRPLACRDVVFGTVKRCTKNCTECWNEPYKEENDE